MSNLLIELTHNGADLLYNATTYYTQQPNNKGLVNQSGSAITSTNGTLTDKRLNTRFYIDGNTVAWTPATDLYTDAAASVPYTGQNIAKVYAKISTEGAYSYEAIISNSGCEKTTSTSIIVNEVVTPTILQSNFCTSIAVENIEVNSMSGATILWYADGTLTELTESGTYYVSQSIKGCVSERTMVDMTAVEILTAPESADVQIFCEGVTVNDLQAVATTGTLGWFENEMDVAALDETTPLSTGTYYVAQFNGVCWSEKTAVNVVIIPIPTAPIVSDQAYCSSENKTVADIVATGENIQWGATVDAATALAPTTVLTTGTYYASQTINGCESSSRTAIQVVVHQVMHQ